ncbi:MAG: MFS transporter [Planctomycetota bacterium]|nr:MAG: MFS transporter [Planctomycetota bacterium]
MNLSETRNPLQAGSVTHPSAYRTRRMFNWVPLGVTYAFLYMGRYNLTVAKNALGDLMSLEQFGDIFGVGTAVYAMAFVLNGPLTDRLGGRAAILLAAGGAALANLLMGLFTHSYIVHGTEWNPTLVFAALYALNMYFQSFGAVAIVKVNSNWFHVNERGTFSAIFGAIISSGIYLAFDVGYRIVQFSIGRGPGGVDATWLVFFVPAAMLALFFLVDFLVVRDFPSHAGLQDIETGAAVLSDNDEPIPTLTLLRKVLTHPIILTLALIEFCTGVLRNGIMHWYPLYAKSALVLGNHFMIRNWGLILFAAGVLGGGFAGLVSDKLFQSRRAPAAGGLYLGLVVAVFAMIFCLGGTLPEVGWISTPPAPAVEQNLHSGDLIVAVDGQPVRSRAHTLARFDALGTFRLKLWRRDRFVETTLRVDADNYPAFKFRKNLITVQDPGIEGAGKAALFWRGAWAYEQGLRKGDRIRSVNGTEPEDWRAFLDALRLDGSDNRVVIERDGAQHTLTVWQSPYAPSTPEGHAKYVAAGPTQTLDPFVLGFLAFFISLCVIGTHGLLSGTATMDFGGKRGTATTVGMIDGFVYLGTAVQSFALGRITSFDWAYWPIFLLPFAVVGFFLCTRIWHVKPKGRAGH